MERARRVVLLGAGFGVAVLAAVITESGARELHPAEAAAAPARLLQFTAQGLTADITDVPLQQLLEAIAREARLRIVTDVPVERRVTIRFRDLSLEEALRRLLRFDGVVFVYSAASTATRSRLTEVRAYVGSGTPFAEGAGTHDQSASVPEPSDGAVLAGVRHGVEESRRLQEEAPEAVGHPEDAEIVDALTHALGDEDPDVRESAARALGRTWDESAVKPLSRALLDEDGWVREAAARALGKIWSEEAAEILSDVVVNDRSRSVREAAAEALGDLADPRAVPSLIVALQDPAGSIRERAAEALAAIGSNAALRPLIETALRDDDPWVRQEAEQSIAQLSAAFLTPPR
jgi:hypothetical protein